MWTPGSGTITKMRDNGCEGDVWDLSLLWEDVVDTEVYGNIGGGAPREAFHKCTSKSTSTSPCLNFFKLRSSQAAYYFVTDSSFESNTLTWTSPSWTHSHPVKLILTEKAAQTGATSGQQYSKTAWGFGQGLYLQEESKLMPLSHLVTFLEMSLDARQTRLGFCRNFWALEM